MKKIKKNIKTAVIHEFEAEIYPRKLWVAKGGNALSVIREHFTERDGSPISFTGQEELGFDALTLEVKGKDTGKYGVLIWFRSNYIVKNTTHEAAHAAISICSDIGLALAR